MSSDTPTSYSVDDIIVLNYPASVRERHRMYLDQRIPPAQRLAHAITEAFMDSIRGLDVHHAVLSLHDAHTLSIIGYGKAAPRYLPSQILLRYEYAPSTKADAAVLLALSRHASTRLHRDGIAHRYTYIDGKRQEADEPARQNSNIQGVELVMKVDPDFFEGAALDFKLIEDAIALRSYFSTEVTMVCHDRRTSDYTTFHARIGMSALLDALTSHHDTLYREPVHIVHELDDGTIDLHLNWIAHHSCTCRARLHGYNVWNAPLYVSESSPFIQSLLDELSTMHVSDDSMTWSLVVVFDLRIGSQYTPYSTYIHNPIGQSHIAAIRDAILCSPELLKRHER